MHKNRRRSFSSRSEPRGDRPDKGLSREVKIVSAVVVLGVVMSLLDTTIVSVALDTLSRDLHSSLATIQWVSTGYLLSLAMVIPLAGWYPSALAPSGYGWSRSRCSRSARGYAGSRGR